MAAQENAISTRPSGEKLGGRADEIREVSTRLFYEHGYNATSLKDIAKVMGLRAPSLYNHISSKQQVLQDIMFDNTYSLRSAFDSAVIVGKDTTEKLRLASESLMRHTARNRYQVHVSMSDLRNVEDPAKSQLIRLRAENFDRWRNLIRQGCTEGVFSTKHPGLAAQSILDLGAGVAYWFRPGGLYDEETFAKYYSEIALRIVGVDISED